MRMQAGQFQLQLRHMRALKRATLISLLAFTAFLHTTTLTPTRTDSIHYYQDNESTSTTSQSVSQAVIQAVCQAVSRAVGGIEPPLITTSSKYLYQTTDDSSATSFLGNSESYTETSDTDGRRDRRSGTDSESSRASDIERERSHRSGRTGSSRRMDQYDNYRPPHGQKGFTSSEEQEERNPHE